MNSKRETRRDSIIDAAFHLFLKNGYQNTKIIDIANAAGIGKGTVYEYFNSKEMLLAEILQTKVVQYYEETDTAISSLSDCRSKLCAFLEFQKECFKKYDASLFDMRHQLLNMDKQLSLEILKAIHSVIMLQYQTVYRIVETGISSGELREGVNPSLAANCLLGAINAYVSVKYSSNAKLPYEIEIIRTSIPTSGIETWTEDSFLDILYAGLGKNAGDTICAFAV